MYTTNPGTPNDASVADAGTDAGSFDAGSFDAGVPFDGGHFDAGLPRDGGVRDGGSGTSTDGGVATAGFPTVPGWTFYGPDAGGPREVHGVSADEGGNIWVAGGEDGLFLLAPGATRFRQFGLKDGLHPYGYLPNGAPATTTPYLNVISVAGGPPGVVFVGYHGKWGPSGEYDCEDNWDTANPNPDIYKSGDADRVTLGGSGLSVVHYDIFSGPSVVGGEPQGREKLCIIWTIRYDGAKNSVWFGGNHGFAWGDATYAGNPSCNGQLSCSGLIEHSHPGFNGYFNDTNNDCCAYVTEDYRGVAIAPSHDVWMGGANRTTLFKWVTSGNFWTAQSITENPTDWSDRIDVWPDAVSEPNYPHPSQRKDDNVMGAAAMGDGSVWVGSSAYGLARIDASGHVLGYVTSELTDTHISALNLDANGRLWIGYRWGGGIDRMNGGQVEHFAAAFGPNLSQSPVYDIQPQLMGPGQRVLVAFGKGPTVPAGIGIYSGP